LFKMDGIDIEFTKECLQEIVRQAVERKTGARGLRSIIEKSLLDLMFLAPSYTGLKEIRLTPELIRGDVSAQEFLESL
jgi:ATP-dependent Clp protease ATP-binding subunit ClpX